MRHYASHRSRSLIVILFLLLLFSFWSAIAQDGEPLPLPDTETGIKAFTPLKAFALPVTPVNVGNPANTVRSLFGYDLSRDRDLMVIGMPYHRSPTGRAIIYSATGNGTWVQIADLISDDTGMNDRFGFAVAIYRTTVFVGAPDHNAERGAVYVFNLDSSCKWVLTQKFHSLFANSRGFGTDLHVDPDGSQLIIAGGATGTAEIYIRGPNNQWMPDEEITLGDPVISAFIEGDYALLGALDENGEEVAHIYRRDTGGWNPAGHIQQVKEP